MTVRGELLAYHSGMPKRLSCAVRRWYVVEQRVLTMLPPIQDTRHQQGQVLLSCQILFLKHDD